MENVPHSSAQMLDVCKFVAIDEDNDDIDDDDDDDDETEFYPFSWTADPRSAAVIDLLPGFNMSHEMFTMIEKRLDSPSSSSFAEP